jgi:hypothetical protein
MIGVTSVCALTLASHSTSCPQTSIYAPLDKQPSSLVELPRSWSGYKTRAGEMLFKRNGAQPCSGLLQRVGLGLGIVLRERCGWQKLLPKQRRRTRRK